MTAIYCTIGYKIQLFYILIIVIFHTYLLSFFFLLYALLLSFSKTMRSSAIYAADFIFFI